MKDPPAVFVAVLRGGGIHGHAADGVVHERGGGAGVMVTMLAGRAVMVVVCLAHRADFQCGAAGRDTRRRTAYIPLGGMVSREPECTRQRDLM